MKNNIIELDDHRHWMNLYSGSSAYTVPLKMFEDYISGRMVYEDIEGFDDILKIVIKEWLEKIHGRSL